MLRSDAKRLLITVSSIGKFAQQAAEKKNPKHGRINIYMYMERHQSCTSKFICPSFHACRTSYPRSYPHFRCGLINKHRKTIGILFLFISTNKSLLYCKDCKYVLYENDYSYPYSYFCKTESRQNKRCQVMLAEFGIL